jgi:aldehyde dehydrogenase (NAD+)
MGATNMINRKQFYIDGAWVDPVAPHDHHVINPATEEAFATISLGGQADAIKAILAARAAFPSFSQTSVDERVALLEKIIALYSALRQPFPAKWARPCGSPVQRKPRQDSAISWAR